MKKHLSILGICCIVLSIFFANVAAANVNDISTSGLTEEQRAELALMAAKMKTTEKEIDVVEKIQKFTGVGARAGQELADFAAKAGVGIDSFLKTDSGKWTLAVIIWMVAGKDFVDVFGNVISFIVGTGLFFILFPGWIYFFRRLCLLGDIKITYHENGKKKEKIVEALDHSDDSVQTHRMFMLIILIIIVVGSVIIAI